MKILDFATIKKLAGGGITARNLFDMVDHVLKTRNEFLMPSKTRMGQDNGDYFAVMPCLHKQSNTAMVKMIGRHMLHEGEKRSVMMSDLMLYEADTGILKAVMDAEYITTLRTGATAAHAAILYGKKDFSTIGLMGLGNIMTVCAEVLFEKLKDCKIIVKLYKYHNHEERFIERFRKYENIKFVKCDTYKDVISDSDVIISAVTNVTENFCGDECYKEGVTVIPVMTRGFMNCDLFFDKVFTDEIEQIRGFKYFDRFKSVHNTTEVLCGKAEGRTSDSERILVYNYGLAAMDLYFAETIYSELENKGKSVDYKYCEEKYFM